MPTVLATSRTDAVGSPPLQKNASILSSFSASADALTDKACRRMSRDGVESGRPQHAKRDNLGPAARRPGRHHFASEVRQPLDPLAVDRDDVRVVRIEHRKRPCPDRAGSFEKTASLDRLVQRVGEHEREIDLPELQQLEVVNRSRRHFRRRLDSWQRIADDFGQSAAVRVVDAAGIARGNRQAGDPAVIAGELAGIENRAETAEDDRGDQQDDGASGKGIVSLVAAATATAGATRKRRPH